MRYISEKLPKKLKELNLDPVPMIVFPKGAWYALDSMCDSGYNIVGLDWLHAPAEAAKIRGDRNVVLQGNADPGILYGSHEAITETVKEMVEGFGWHQKKKGWIVNLGHGEIDLITLLFLLLLTIPLGITPLVNPDDLKFYFQEIHRQTSSS